MIDYTFIRSRRKSIGIIVKADGSVEVRVPLRCSKRQAEVFVNEKLEWIKNTQKKIASRKKALNEGDVQPAFTKAELDSMRKKAKQIIPAMVSEVAKEMGVSYGTVTIRAQKTRWGSCSSKGNLNFNCLLVLMPENVMRYVVVHELCHLKEMNHSKRFWNYVAMYQPTYAMDKKQLKELGTPLIQRIV